MPAAACTDLRGGRSAASRAPRPPGRAVALGSAARGANAGRRPPGPRQRQPLLRDITRDSPSRHHAFPVPTRGEEGRGGGQGGRARWSNRSRPTTRSPTGRARWWATGWTSASFTRSRRPRAMRCGPQATGSPPSPTPPPPFPPAPLAHARPSARACPRTLVFREEEDGRRVVARGARRCTGVGRARGGECRGGGGGGGRAGGPHRSLLRRRAPARRPSTRRRLARGPRLTLSPVALLVGERKDSEARGRG